jgi:hypothetical protein
MCSRERYPERGHEIYRLREGTAEREVYVVRYLGRT